MNGSSRTDGFGTAGANPVDGMWQAFEQLRTRLEKNFEKSAGSRVGRGDVRAAVLALLAEQPMHGYQIIHQIEERSGGRWKPSAGSVYPTLQLLADEGLITAEESNDRKTYSLTEAGRDEVNRSGVSAPWSAKEDEKTGSLPKAGIELAQAAAQVGRTGTDAQTQQAVEVLNDARRKLYAILAQS
ncbi:PadR family transcriptional regulator [Amnibacterium flavum]|uniref:PadR family transcriptional regulator n=1 Tax=Amnibacterium flavum TaxID=2173173 RepID=A0A2V1HUB6_9MICO|nr:PadR family transcriptional regulator [Amnibacterium flavum]PVZ94550.1 PadR family transcriptional regulator [Amnibacterium flavum]